ncbi:EboA domain-containing protein [Egicoccus sp. AB-alg2]|uniref:EboA domain-containing protein n=1 Tax=Egicoccus sp. AB-alg2 TaxID=3242693 RepID=UPI00359E8A37
MTTTSDTPVPDAAALLAMLDRRLEPDGRAWYEAAVAAVRADPTAVRARFPAVGRELGRRPLAPDADPQDLHIWWVEDAGRAGLLLALGPAVEAELADLYRFGDAAERRGILRALPYLDLADHGVGLVEDALRTNDLRLIAAALGPAADHLDDHAFAQAVLKAVFVGLPLHGVSGLDRRVTPDLSRMLAGYVHERIAAGRDVPAEVWPLIDRHPPADELAAITAELDHPVADRRDAARAALRQRAVRT